METVVCIIAIILLGWLAYQAYEWQIKKCYASPTGAEKFCGGSGGCLAQPMDVAIPNIKPIAEQHDLQPHPIEYSGEAGPFAQPYDITVTEDPNVVSLVPLAYAYFNQECSDCPCSYDEPCNNQLNTFSTSPQLAQSSAPCCAC